MLGEGRGFSAMVVEGGDEGLDGHQHPRGRVSVAGQHFEGGGQPLAEGVQQCRGHQLVLGSEVVGDGGQVGARLGGDVARCGGGQSSGGNAMAGRLEKPAFCFSHTYV